jgi:predicted ester cyclase
MTKEYQTNLSNAAIAQNALERVCSGRCLAEASQYYSPVFIDHVNGERLVGFAGIEQSVELYKRFINGLAITVQDQLTEGDRVMCRFVVAGFVYGRKVSIDGITVSRIENERIVEDWSVTDTASLLRQIGVWRALWIALRNSK